MPRSSQLPETAANRLLYRGHISSGASSPPESPLSSPERSPAQAPSSPLSFDHLPPAMSAYATTPAPSADHSDMDSHNADNLDLEDDDEHLEDHRHHYRQNRHHQSSRHRYEDHSPQSSSRPNSPPLPPTTTTILAHPLSNSINATPSSSFSSTEPSSSTLSPQQTTASTNTSSQNENHHGHTLSPFSFFSSNSVLHGNGSSSKTLRIELSQPDVVLMSGQSTVLEGVVYVNLHKNTKVKSLLLEFSGRSSVTWVDDNAYSPATRHTTAPHIEHSWALIPHHHKQPSTQLQSGIHSYPFSLELPDTLPETLTTMHGKVAYRLTATLTKPGLTFHSSTATIPVLVHRRHPVQASRAYQRGGRAVSAPEDKIKYKITLPQIRVPHSTKIPLQVSITAPTLRTHVQVLQVALWERAVYRADGRKRVDMRLVKIQKSEGWDRPVGTNGQTTEAWNWNKVLLFDMPSMGSEQNQCNPSADNGLMKVAHILRFSILGTDGNKRFRVENEIDLKVLAFEDDYQMDPEDEGDERNDGELPSYLTSFTTPRVSFDSERDMDPADDDLLRAMIQRIHLPTYAESEEDANSRNPSRDVSRNTSRAPSRVASRTPSRNVSPERSASAGSLSHTNHHHHHLHHLHHHGSHGHHHHSHSPGSLSTGHSPVPSTVVTHSPLATSTSVSDDEQAPVSPGQALPATSGDLASDTTGNATTTTVELNDPRLPHEDYITIPEKQPL
ncbi:hypothetical protein BGX28_004336 [Mortierella sp. GBA30]|nr:hypothetical protein BGX28_004336 [Mortierella sp. GBA30]